MTTRHKPVVLQYIENMPIMSYMCLVYEEMTFKTHLSGIYPTLKYLRFIIFIIKSLRTKGILNILTLNI